MADDIEEKLISVIIPIYKTEKYLCRCVDSIIQQTHRNLEIILVDDGSPDGSGKICDQYAQQDSRIKVIHKKNGGLSDARNKGIESSAGEYLCFVDSDDYVSQYFCQLLYELCEKYQTRIACCEFAHVLNDSFFQNETKYDLANVELWQRRRVFEIMASSRNQHGLITIACNKMYSRELFDNVRYPEGKLHEDEGTTYKLLYLCEKVAYIPAKLYAYFQTSSSITRNEQSLQRRKDFSEFLAERYFFFCRNNENSLATHWGCVFGQGAIPLYYEMLSNQETESALDVLSCFRRVLCKLARHILNRPVLLARFLIFAALPPAYKFLLQIFNAHVEKKEVLRVEKAFRHVRKSTNSSAVVLIATPTHGNLGDQAIVLAQRKFISDMGYADRIVEITSQTYNKHSCEIKRLISDADVIVIDGGGNMGTLWVDEERKMQQIISSFPENHIYIFPQTVFYSSDEFGMSELETAKKIYNRHNQIVICSREAKSFHFNSLNFSSADNLLVPDIVLYLDCHNYSFVRKGALVVLRSDKERNLCSADEESFRSVLRNKNLDVSYSSTLIDGFVSKENRQEKVEEKLKEFAKVQLVVTDRLHAMIFACVTGTPCVAFDNLSGKVHGMYEWLQEYPYVQICSGCEDFEEKMNSALATKDIGYSIAGNSKYFDDLKHRLQSSIDLIQ